VVCILSHGFEEAVYGANSIALRITDIENLLCSYETLYNKPKLLIIQACQEEVVKKDEQNQIGLPVRIFFLVYIIKTSSSNKLSSCFYV